MYKKLSRNNFKGIQWKQMLCQIRVIYQNNLPMLTWGILTLRPWASHCFFVSKDKDHINQFNKLLRQFPRNFEKWIFAHDTNGWSLLSLLRNITNVHSYILNSTSLTHTSRQLITELSDGRAHILTAVH